MDTMVAMLVVVSVIGMAIFVAFPTEAAAEALMLLSKLSSQTNC
jgi:hypothetical protein